MTTQFGVRHLAVTGCGLLAMLLAGALCAPRAHAGDVPLGAGSGYSLMFEGDGSVMLSVTNVTIDGNVGVGTSGKLTFAGTGDINGALDFAAGFTGQYSNPNISNVGPTSVAYGDAAVTSALSTVNNLNTSLTGTLGTSLSISGNQTINESAGTLETINGVTYRVFTVTSPTARATVTS